MPHVQIVHTIYLYSLWLALAFKCFGSETKMGSNEFSNNLLFVQCACCGSYDAVWPRLHPENSASTSNAYINIWYVKTVKTCTSNLTYLRSLYLRSHVFNVLAGSSSWHGLFVAHWRSQAISVIHDILLQHVCHTTRCNVRGSWGN